jgi:hypothetical protein
MLICEFQRKRPIGISKSKLEVNMNMGVREIVFEAGKWVQRTQNRVLWWSYVNRLLNIVISCRRGVSSLAEVLSVYRKVSAPWSQLFYSGY